MNLRSILIALALCLGTVSHTAHAVNCAANMTASNPDAAYTYHGDGTATHVPTGLMWNLCSEGQSWDGSKCTGITRQYTPTQRLTLGSASRLAGHADWRLPNIKELRSLVEECRNYPAINDTIFPATGNYPYWSSSAGVQVTGDMWAIDFSDGSSYPTNAGSSGYVRLVRGGLYFGSFDSSNDIALSPSTLTFTAQNPYTTSLAQTVTLRNGNAPLNIASIVASGDYAVTHNCGASLGAGGFCTLNITFTPTATSTRTGSITITDDALFSLQTISLNGTGQGGVASLSTTAMAFASQNQGSTSAAQTITLTNPGGAVLNIASIVASGEFAQTTTCGATLAQGANCTISVAFTPTVAGTRSGSIAITSDAASSPDAISLSGTGVGAPMVSLNPISLNFAAQNVGTSSAAQTIALTNTGGATLTIHSIIASGDFAATNNCGAGVWAGGFCNLSVTFTPTVAGNRTGAITITSNATGSPHSVSLSNIPKANQTIGAISFSPTSLTVNSITMVSATATSDLAVSFSSTTPSVCTVSGNTVTGIAVGACTIAANQAGDASYNAATQVTQIIAISTTSQAVVEFYNANINHYFMTASLDEAVVLDNKTDWGWARTGKTFNVWLNQASAPSASPVCRFFGVFANGTVGSHFYTADPVECANVKGRLDWGWGYENDAFYAVQPTGGTCPSGTSPVYRVYNNGMGGAPNHRYMANQTDVSTMVAQGWVSEGTGTAFCGAQ